MKSLPARKIGMLHKMVEAASNGDLKWSKVYNYMESYVTTNRDDASSSSSTLFEDAPFPPNTTPTEQLRAELVPDAEGNSLLRRAVLKCADYKIVAALCQLSPHALQATDRRGRVPLHHACRLQPDAVVNKLLRLLISACPETLVARDSGGRTPLHYLLWYHASLRTPEVCAAFLMPIDKSIWQNVKQYESSSSTSYPLPEIPTPSSAKKVTNCAAIVPDAKHGCLPIHYAVMEGASIAVIQTLLKAYPLSKHMCDRYGRTPLHWYLGAGYLKIEDHDDASASSSPITHVSGEAMDPNATPWYKHRLDPHVVQLLVSSRVARTYDAMKRSPLHWAAHFWGVHFYHEGEHQHQDELLDEEDEDPAEQCPLAVSTVKVILDHHVGQLETRDCMSMTPLMVLFETTARLQERDYHALQAKHDPEQAGPLHIDATVLNPFSVPIECIDLLLEFPDASPEKVSSIEDSQGRLPIHAALEVAAPPDVIDALIESYPACLLHTTMDETLYSPMHCAFRRPCSAPLQSKIVMELLVQTYEVSRHGTTIDGRLAMKMEDSSGFYPLHYACQNNAPCDVIEFLVGCYPRAATLQSDELLPIHCLVDEALLEAAIASPNELQPWQQELLDSTRDKMRPLFQPLLSDPRKLHAACHDFGMLPLHVAVLFEAAPYPLLLSMLQKYPDAALAFMAHPKYSYSCLDLHEIRKSKWQGTAEEWHCVRELLFSFGPTLESHRHREELLSRCVHIVANEVAGKGSFHFSVGRETEENPLEIDLTHTLSAMSVPSTFHRPVSPARFTESPTRPVAKRKNPVKHLKVITKQPLEPKREKDNGAISRYDETETGMEYVLSDTEYDDDSYFSEEYEEEETYFPEDIDRDDVTKQSGLSAVESSLKGDISLLDASHTLSSECFGVKSNQTGTTHSTTASLDRIFMEAKRKAELEEKMEASRKAEEEEKKTDDSERDEMMGIEFTQSRGALCGGSNLSSQDSLLSFAPRPEWASEVGIRLWAFFAFYQDKDNPNDNYSKQAGEIFDEVGFDRVQVLVTLPLPSCACAYFRDTPKKRLKRQRFLDVANPKCRELIHRTNYFLGKFDFDVEGSDILVHRSPGIRSVSVRAYEWVFTTEAATDAANPGVSEESIWHSGVVPAQKGLTFDAYKRPVRIHFTKDSQAYLNEVYTRAAAEIPIAGVFENYSSLVPILYHFNANDDETKSGRMYRMAINNERFKMLKVIRGACAELGDEIDLSTFPYAIVYPDVSSQSLSEFLLHQRVSSSGAKKVCRDVCGALKILHSKGVVHSNVSPSSVLLSRPSADMAAGRDWLLSDFSVSVPPGVTAFLGAITSEGFGQFKTATLPPEMFTVLSPAELKDYRGYWQYVGQTFDIDLDHCGVEPKIDPQSGKAFVAKCHFVPPSRTAGSLPSLPYDLVSVSHLVDLWALGLLIFELYAGRALFPVDIGTGWLLDYGEIAGWSEDIAKARVYEHVSNPLVQDILLRLLSVAEKRKNETIESVLRHPLFAEIPVSPVLVEKHRIEAAAFRRSRDNKVMELSEATFLESRTLKVNCWDFGLLERFHHSPTEMVKRMILAGSWRNSETIPFPSSVVILPYKLSSVDGALEGETTEKIQEFGCELLKLHKACHFARAMRKKLESLGKSARSKWSTVDVVEAVGLSYHDFHDVQESFSELVSRHIELFRTDPLEVAFKLVLLRIKVLFDLFEDGAYLYLVDEYKCEPILEGMYPLSVDDDWKEKLFDNVLLIMYLNSLYARGVAKSECGLCNLLCGKAGSSVLEEAWSNLARGLDHVLDEDRFLDELRVLQDVLTERSSIRHRFGTDLYVIRDFLYECDPMRTFANLKRVSTADMSLWTTEENANEIKVRSSDVSFKDALARMK